MRKILSFKITVYGITSVVIFSLTGCSWLFKNPNLYTVKSISDGDTMTVTTFQGETLKVRFACVDAPEVPHSAVQRQSRKRRDKNQFHWGEQAKNRLQQLVNTGGGTVSLTITDTDRYGRKISEVRLPNGTLVQEVLAREGLTLVYRPYLKDCPSSPLVEQAEATAKRQKQGVWNDPKFLPPWEYRQL